MAETHAGKIEETFRNPKALGSKLQLTLDEQVLENCYRFVLVNGAPITPISFGPGELETLKTDLFELYFRRGRRLVELCRYFEFGLMTTDPIPRGLAEPALIYLSESWISLEFSLGFFLRFNFSELDRKTKPEFVFIEAIWLESRKLHHLLRFEDPDGRFIDGPFDPDFGPDIEFDDIGPRNAIRQIRKVVDFIESCLKQIETIMNHSTPEPLTPQQIKFEETVDSLAIALNPNKLSPLHYEILLELYRQKTNLSPGDISGLLKARELNHKTDSIQTQLNRLKEKGFVKNPARNSWVITDAGYGCLKNDVRFRNPKVIGK